MGDVPRLRLVIKVSDAGTEVFPYSAAKSVTEAGVPPSLVTVARLRHVAEEILATSSGSPMQMLQPPLRFLAFEYSTETGELQALAALAWSFWWAKVVRGTELGDKEELVGVSFSGRLGRVGKSTSMKPFIAMYDSGVRKLPGRRLRRLTTPSIMEERVS